ncbi:hypothetical protein ACH4C2_13375 [Streptomyces sp. NPDC018057]|uniref:hypothetical protein n=1 Tax=unclassified Streptomyces TaxID=2593676 RepID=UPI0037978716
MQNQTPDGSASEVEAWTEGAHRNASGLASSLGVSPDRYAEDPLLAVPGLQSYVERLPLNEFEQSDWIGLHTDLTSFLGDLLVRRYPAHWVKAEDPNSPMGYRYMVEAKGLDGRSHRVEPYDVVMEEFHHLPIEIVRMIANAEAVLHLTPTVDELAVSEMSLEELMGETKDSD